MQFDPCNDSLITIWRKIAINQDGVVPSQWDTLPVIWQKVLKNLGENPGPYDNAHRLLFKIARRVGASLGSTETTYTLLRKIRDAGGIPLPTRVYFTPDGEEAYARPEPSEEVYSFI